MEDSFVRDRLENNSPLLSAWFFYFLDGSEMKKFLKVTGILLLVLGLAGFFAFTALVWNPFEGVVPEIRKAVPRNVDFFAGKRDLAGDFSEFPVPYFYEDFEASTGAGPVKDGDLFRSLARNREVQNALQEIERVKAQLGEIPVLGVSILGDLIGKDFVVAGKFSQGGGTPTWAAYTRVSWKIRAAFGFLRFDGVREGLQGLRITWEEPLFRIQAPGGVFFAAMHKDLLMVGNQKEFLAQSYDLIAGLGDGESFVSLSDYQDQRVKRLKEWMQRTGEQDPNYLEFALSVPALARAMPELPFWEKPREDGPQELKLLHSFVNPKAMHRLWGNLVFVPEQEESPPYLASLLTVDLNRGELTPSQNRFQSTAPGERETWLRAMLQNIPQKAAAAFALRIPVHVFLEQFANSMDPDMRKLVDEGLVSSGQRGGLRGLIARVGSAFKPFVLVVVRNNDYPLYKKEFEVATPSPAPAVAWIFQANRREKKRVEELVQFFDTNYRNFGFDPKARFTLPAGPRGFEKIREWGNPQIPATGELALVNGSDQMDGLFLVSNSGKLLREIINARFSEAGVTALAADPLVSASLDTLPPKVSGFGWFQGEGLRDLMGRYREAARRRVEEGTPDPTWMLENRRKIEDEVFSRDFRGRYRSKAEIRGADRKRFDQAVGKLLDLKWRTEEMGVRGKSLDRKFAEAQAWLEFIEAGTFFFRNREKDLTFEAKAFFRF